MKYSLEIVVFIAGFILMTVEISGARIIAPFVGTSIYAWTSLIGVILGSLSVGSWFGGRLADKDPNIKVLSNLLFAAGFMIALTAISKEGILVLIDILFSNVQVKSVMSSIFLFALQTAFIGAVFPYAARLKIKEASGSGKIIGSLSAMSSIGSIFGTFVTGFYLLSVFGVTSILFISSAIFLISALLFRRTNTRNYTLFALFISLFFPASLLVSKVESKGFVLKKDTQYNRITVLDINNVRILKLDTEFHSARFLDSEELVFPYSEFYRLGDYFVPDIKEALMLGGGGYSYPKDFIARHPNSKLDVVEIDPAVTETAERFFNLKKSSNLNIYHEDARTFVNKSEKKYDAIYIDAFSSFISIPYQLTTSEAVRSFKSLLSDNGVVVLNIISSLEGRNSKFFQAEFLTYSRVFKNVYAFPVGTLDNVNVAQNIMIVATDAPISPPFKNTDSVFSTYLKHYKNVRVPDNVPILTDDFSPVDQYIF